MSDGVWMSVSEAAQARGVSKQAISKRLKSLAGQVTTRQDGPRLLFNVVEYDRVTSANTDPAQALRNRDLPPRDDAPAAPRAAADNVAARVFSTQRARREGYDAENARLDLEERMGKLLRVEEVEEAMARFASILIREIDQLPAEVDDPGLRKILMAKARNLRATVAQEMRLLTKGKPADETDESQH